MEVRINRRREVKGEICLFCENEEERDIILTSLKPEQQEGKIKIERCEKGVRIIFEANNIVEARAIANTILRLVKAVEDALNLSL